MTRLIFISLFVFCGSLLTNAETGGAITTDTLKGKIWTFTAARIRIDRGFSKKPPVWPTDSDFTTWRKESGPNDKLGMVRLWNAVRIRISDKNGRTPATSQQLTEAIIAEIREPSPLNKSDFNLVKSSALKLQLDSLLEASANQPKKSSLQEPARKSKMGDMNSEPRVNSAEEFSSQNQDVQKNQEDGLLAKHPILILVFIASLSFLLGAIASIFYRHPTASPDQQIGNGNSTNNGGYVSRKKYEDLKQEKTELLNKITELKRTISASQTDSGIEVKSTNKDSGADVVSSMVTGQSGSFYQQQESASASIISIPASQPIQSRYAPASEGAYVEDRKVVDRAMDKLPIMLSLSSNNPDRATFALNPGVNQDWLIKVGLEKLREYFDFQMPISKPVAVAAAGQGQLTRQGEGWQVTTRAKLTIR